MRCAARSPSKQRNRPCGCALLFVLPFSADEQRVEQARRLAQPLGVNLDGPCQDAEKELIQHGKEGMKADGRPLKGSPFVKLWLQSTVGALSCD